MIHKYYIVIGYLCTLVSVVAGISFPADSRDCIYEGFNYIKNGFGVGKEVFVLSYSTQSFLAISQISKTYPAERPQSVMHFCCSSY